MTSLENASVLPPPLYSSHEFAPSAFPQCSSTGVLDANPSTSTPNDDELVTATVTSTCSPSRCATTNKTPNCTSVASLNHTSSPSPSYPSANSWPGFGGKNSRIDDIQAAAVGSGEANKSPSQQMQHISEFNKQPRKSADRVFVFSSKMANEAIGRVQQNKYDSIVAWHEANCRPSTSSGEVATPHDTPPAPLTNKRKSTQELRTRSPVSTNEVTTTTQSPTTPRSQRNVDVCLAAADSRTTSTTCEHQPDGPPTSSNDLLMLTDDVETSTDNPLRRMERMTQDSLFEPPAKVIRSASTESNQPARRDQERNAKLEKMRTLEQQIMIDKARFEWDRMVHEHEAIKMAQGGYAPMVQGYPPQVVGPPMGQYQVQQSPGMPPMHPAYRRAPYPMQQVAPSQSLSPVAPPAGVLMGTMPSPSMPMSQPLRPSLNPPPYSMHVPPDGYVPYGYAPNGFPPQGYPPNMSPSVSPGQPQMYAPINGNQIPPRGYPMYPQGMRAMYTEKMMPPEVWPQRLPQPLGNIEARIPSQKIQYHPNGTVLDDGLIGEDVAKMNMMYG